MTIYFMTFQLLLSSSGNKIQNATGSSISSVRQVLFRNQNPVSNMKNLTQQRFLTGFCFQKSRGITIQKFLQKELTDDDLFCCIIIIIIIDKIMQLKMSSYFTGK